MPPKKPPEELTTEEAIRKLFPKRVVDEARKAATEKPPKHTDPPKPRSRRA